MLKKMVILKLQSAVNSTKPNQILNYLLKLLIRCTKYKHQVWKNINNEYWKYFEKSQFMQIRFVA